MSRPSSARPSALSGVVAAAAAGVLLSAAAGAALGYSQGQDHTAPHDGSGAVTSWLEASADDTVQEVSSAMADHQLRHRGEAVLGASASLGGVPFESLHLQLAASSIPTPADARSGLFRAQAIVEYQLAVDDVVVGRRADAVFRLKGGAWRLVHVAPSGLDLWDHEPVQSVREGRVLALGADGDSRVPGLALTAERSRADVAEFWTAPWPATVVVVLPSDARLLNPLLGVRSSGDDQVAVTRWETGRDGPVIRVLVNPTYYDQMSSLAREIVLRHEITHVAQDALPHEGVPNWLTEGLAEYVGYRGSGIAPELIAAQLFEQVRTSGPGDQLPDDDAFDFDQSQAERRVAYGSGWAFHQMLAERYGEGTLVPFYVAVARGDGPTAERLDAAADRVYGVGFDRLVRQWRAWLRDNA